MINGGLKIDIFNDGITCPGCGESHFDDGKNTVVKYCTKPKSATRRIGFTSFKCRKCGELFKFRRVQSSDVNRALAYVFDNCEPKVIEAVSDIIYGD